MRKREGKVKRWRERGYNYVEAKDGKIWNKILRAESGRKRERDTCCHMKIRKRNRPDMER